MRSALLFVAVAMVSCGPPVMNTPLEEIPKLTTLAAVMDNQATVADPEMKKAGESSYADADYSAFAKVAERIKVTSLKIKDFSKGPEFDALAMQLNTKAEALGNAAAAKDAAAASQALTEMKATCKDCHSKFR